MIQKQYTLQTDENFSKEIDEISASYTETTKQDANKIINLIDQQHKKTQAYRPDNAIAKAIKSRKIYYAKGGLKGKFSLEVVAELKKLGAHWNEKDKCYKIEIDKLPFQAKNMLLVVNEMNTELKKELNNYQQKQEINKKKETNKTTILANIFVLSKVFSNVKKNNADFILHVKTGDEEDNEKKQDFIKDDDKFNERVKSAIETIDYDIKGQTYEATKEMRSRFMKAMIGGKNNAQLKQIVESHIQGTEARNNFITKQEMRIELLEYQKKLFQQNGFAFFKWIHRVPYKPSDRDQHIKWFEECNAGKVFKLSDPPLNPQTGKKELPGQPYNCRCKMAIVVDNKNNK